jgi:hypothetical protein
VKSLSRSGLGRRRGDVSHHTAFPDQPVGKNADYHGSVKAVIGAAAADRACADTKVLKVVSRMAQKVDL